MSDAQDIWPMPHYEIGPSKIIHALGVIAAKYNSLEFELLCFLLRYSGLPNSTGQYLFANTNNNLRMELLKQCVSEREPDETARDLVLHFIKCFGACTENRNFLMHSMSAKTSAEDVLNFSKGTKSNPAKINALNLKLEDVRKVADEIAMIEGFGATLSWHLAFRGTVIADEAIPPEALKQLNEMRNTLPRKPDVPHLLLAIPPKAP